VLPGEGLLCPAEEAVTVVDDSAGRCHDVQDVAVSIVGFEPIGYQPRRWTIPTCLVK
jgi:hypothetical protein